MSIEFAFRRSSDPTLGRQGYYSTRGNTIEEGVSTTAQRNVSA
jgi:hypothetical protein